MYMYLTLSHIIWNIQYSIYQSTLIGRSSRTSSSPDILATAGGISFSPKGVKANKSKDGPQGGSNLKT